MKPEPFQREEWPGIDSCFVFKRSGLQTKRDDLIYSFSHNALQERIAEFLAAPDDRARVMFHDSRDRKWVGARAIPFDGNRIVHAGYRPLDNRYLYSHVAYGDFLRPELQAVWGANNVALYAMPFATGAGPAVWCHGLLPDYHAFSGRGGYAFPLRDNRPGHGQFNISPALLAGLAASCGMTVSAEDTFDAILALLSAASYTLRFAEDLEDVFPHVPFPSGHAQFLAASELGREIRAVETFARPAGRTFLTRALARVETEPRGTLDASDWNEGEFFLCADRTGRVSGVPKEIWDFEVSGYRLLPRWLDAREGLVADHAVITQMRDVVGRITELIDLFARADTLLAQILPSALTSGELGLQANEPANGEE